MPVKTRSSECLTQDHKRVRGTALGRLRCKRVRSTVHRWRLGLTQGNTGLVCKAVKDNEKGEPIWFAFFVVLCLVG
ncbi:hypothetical protein ACTVJH_07140 [Desulfoplanes sp. PS50]